MLPDAPDRWTAGIRAALLAAAGSILLGAVSGLTWQSLAPHVEGTVTPDGVVLDVAASQAYFGAEAWFAGVTVVAGVLCALLAFARLGRTGSFALLGLVVGGALASVLAWRVGVHVGPRELSAHGHAIGSRVHLGVSIHAYGVLLCWPIAATVVYFALTAGVGGGGRAGG